MRFSGTVGYATTSETAPGVWTDSITEYPYFGDVIRNARRLDSPPQVPPTLNSDLTLENSFSIIGDAMAYQDFMKMRYVNWNGTKWTITNAEVRRPRLILTTGSQWNGQTA